MSVVYNPLSGNFETKEPGPQGPAGTVSAAGDGSQATPSISFASDTNTGLYRYAADGIGVSTGGNGRLFINSAGNVGVGTSNPTERLQVTDGTYSNFYIAPGYNSGTGTRIGVGGGEFLAFGGAPFSTERIRIDGSGRLLVGTTSAPTSTAVFAGRSDGGAAPVVRLDTTNSAPADGEQLSNLYFGSTSDASFNSGARITARRNGGTWTANTSLPTRLEFSTTANGAATSTERVRIDSSGNVFLRQAGGSERVYFTGSGSASIGPASYATSSTTLYIGNAAIQVSSDERIKENIQDTQLDALAAVNQIKVKDFTWNDPSDTSHNNRNARGKWTGLIAQELVEILPFVVNAPRNENGEIDHDSENIWTLDQSQLCPVLIKAIQQQQEIIAALETRIVALEAN